MVIKKSNSILLGFVSAYFILGILHMSTNIVVSEKLFAALGVSTLLIALAEILNSFNKLIEKTKKYVSCLASKKFFKKIIEIIIIWIHIVSICILILYPFIEIKFNGQVIDYEKVANACTFFSTALLFLSLYLNELEIAVKESEEEIRSNKKLIKILVNSKKKDI